MTDEISCIVLGGREFLKKTIEICMKELKPVEIEDNNLPEVLKATKGNCRIVAVDKFAIPGEQHNVLGEMSSLESALFLARILTTDAAGDTDDYSIAAVYLAYNDKGEYIGGDMWVGE